MTNEEKIEGDLRMTVTEALEFIHNVSWLGSKPGLSRTNELLDRLGRPDRNLRFIHLAGTNGKGSTAAMLESVLRYAGYKTGLYTSPYLYKFNERIRINGENISDNELARVTRAVAPHALAMADSPTEFELVTAIAMRYFADAGCDIVVLEVGMGGRLDSTNVIESPECCVITSIGLDHTGELGETVELISAEKAGIIKKGRPVVLYEQDSAIEEVISAVCRDKGSRLRTADFGKLLLISDDIRGQRFSYKGLGEYHINLLGGHQVRNAAVALEVFSVLREQGWNIPDGAVREGFENCVWPARFEIVSREPWFIVDGGHNPQCAEAVAESLERYFPEKAVTFLIGVMGDKDYGSLTDILNRRASSYIAVAPDNPRSLPAERLAEHLRKYGKHAEARSSIAGGIMAAIGAAGEGGVVCCVGSLYMVGEVRAFFGKY